MIQYSRSPVQLVGMLLLVIGTYWLFLFLSQRRILFPAPSTAGAPPRPPDAHQVWLPLDSGRTEAWYFPPLVPTVGPVPLLLFGHGNAELIDYWPDSFQDPRRWGMAVLLVEFPGYGRSEGRPAESTVRSAFLSAYDWATARGDVDPERIVGYGRSLGGGAIGLLARERPLAAIILESAFTSTRPFAAQFGAPGFLIRDPFDTAEAVEAFDGPLLVLHGEHDEIIPAKHGRELAAAGDGELHMLPCGHNDCPRSWDLILDFLLTREIVAPDIQR